MGGTAAAFVVDVTNVTRRNVSGKFGTLEQMEGIAVFLASSSSDFMTGQSIVLDGGHTIFPY